MVVVGSLLLVVLGAASQAAGTLNVPAVSSRMYYLIPTWLPSLLGSEPGPAPRVQQDRLRQQFRMPPAINVDLKVSFELFDMEPGSKGRTFIRNLLLHGGHADAHRCGPAAHDAAAASPAAADALAVVPCTAAGVATVTTAGVAACTAVSLAPPTSPVGPVLLVLVLHALPVASPGALPIATDVSAASPCIVHAAVAASAVVALGTTGATATLYPLVLPSSTRVPPPSPLLTATTAVRRLCTVPSVAA